MYSNEVIFDINKELNNIFITKNIIIDPVEFKKTGPINLDRIIKFSSVNFCSKKYSYTYAGIEAK